MSGAPCLVGPAPLLDITPHTLEYAFPVKVILSAAGNPLTVREHHSMLLMLFSIREMSKQRSKIGLKVPSNRASMHRRRISIGVVS